MSAERRQLNRHRLELHVRFAGRQGVTRDVSVGGFYLETDAPVPQGAVMQFALMFSRPLTAILCQGRVLRVDFDGSRHGAAVAIQSILFEPAG